MKLEEFKIKEQALIKKKKERSDEEDVSKEEKLEIKTNVVEVKKEIQVKDIQSLDVKEEKLVIKVPRIQSSKLLTKKLDVDRKSIKENIGESYKLREICLNPIKLKIKNLDVTFNHKYDSRIKTEVNVKVPLLCTASLKLKVMDKDKVKMEERREISKVDIKVGIMKARELKLKQLDTGLIKVGSIKEGEAKMGEKLELEEVDFVELLFKKGAGKILSGDPLCIIVEDHREKYEYLIATICREFYREKRGGKPEPIFRDTIDELKMELEPKVSHQIVVVRKAEYSDKLKDILSEFFSRDLGFLILVTDKPGELENKIKKNIPTAEEYLVRIEPVELKDKERILELAMGSKFKVPKISFGESFMKAVKEFNDYLKNYLDYNKAPDELKLRWHKLIAKSPEDLEEASYEHSAMKAFVWIYAWKKYNEVPELENERGVDVAIRDENYEIETLYGCGDPIAKLTEKMEKFSKGEKVYFVLRNVSILMHLRELMSFKKSWKKMGYDVEIFGIDFDNERLIPIEDFAKVIVNCSR